MMGRQSSTSEGTLHLGQGRMNTAYHRAEPSSHDADQQKAMAQRQAGRLSFIVASLLAVSEWTECDRVQAGRLRQHSSHSLVTAP